MGDIDTEIQLHEQRLKNLEEKLVDHVNSDNDQFGELKDLLLDIRHSAAHERERMFETFDKRLVELKSDFKDQYQTKTDAEKLKSKTIWSILAGLFSLSILVIAAMELSQ